MLEVIKCGTKVIENISNTYGEITCVSIRFSNLQYEFTFLQDGVLASIWLCAEQFKIASKDEKLKIGFNANS